MATVNCVINGQKSRGGNTYAAGAVYMGYGNGNTHYEYVLSITSGSFSGTSTSITFNIKMKNSALANNTSRTYRWALLNSDASVIGRDTSINLYFDKHTAVEDANQLAQGTITWGNIEDDTHKTLVIETTELKPNTNYYLVLWAYSTNPTSFLTVSSTQYHADTVIEYESQCSITVQHLLEVEGGDYEPHMSVSTWIEPGTSWTPEPVEVPNTHSADSATFQAWNSDYTTSIGGGVVGADYIIVNQDLSVEVYYKLGGGNVYYNNNGVATKCQVFYNNNGVAVKCEVYYNNNGTATKV